jgi:hypothetical protein
MGLMPGGVAEEQGIRIVMHSEQDGERPRQLLGADRNQHQVVAVIGGPRVKRYTETSICCPECPSCKISP